MAVPEIFKWGARHPYRAAMLLAAAALAGADGGHRIYESTGGSPDSTEGVLHNAGQLVIGAGEAGLALGLVLGTTIYRSLRASDTKPNE